MKQENETTTNPFKDRILRRLYVLMSEALSAMTSGKMLVEQKVPSFAFVMAHRSTLPEDVKQNDDIFLDALFKEDTEEKARALNGDKDFVKDLIPYPVICELPKDMHKRNLLLDRCLHETKSSMYALITEGIGTKSKYLNKDQHKPSLAHPDNIQQYLLISLRRKGLEPVTMAAPVNVNLIKRDGTYGRKLGDFKRYKWLDDLPTDYNKNWK